MRPIWLRLTPLRGGVNCRAEYHLSTLTNMKEFEIVPSEYIPGNDDWIRTLQSMTPEQYRASMEREVDIKGLSLDRPETRAKIESERRVYFNRSFSTRLEGLKAFIDALPNWAPQGEEIKKKFPNLTGGHFESPDQMLSLLRETFEEQDEETKAHSNPSEDIVYTYNPRRDQSSYRFGDHRFGTGISVIVNHGDDVPVRSSVEIRFGKYEWSGKLSEQLQAAGFTLPEHLTNEEHSESDITSEESRLRRE